MNLRYGLKLSLLAILLASTAACAVLKRLGRDGGSPTVLTSQDGKFQLTLPAGWRTETELNEEASLQGSNRSRELYVALLTDTKSDFEGDVSLADFTSVTRNHMVTQIHPTKTTEPTPVTINGNPALQYEVHAAVEGIKAAYIITNVETSEHYHQILTWTLASRFEENRGVLLEVSQTFKALGAAKPTTPNSVPVPPAAAPATRTSDAPKQVP